MLSRLGTFLRSFELFTMKMEELAGINFLCMMEGQDYERALSKIVSGSFLFFQMLYFRSDLGISNSI